MNLTHKTLQEYARYSLSEAMYTTYQTYTDIEFKLFESLVSTYTSESVAQYLYMYSKTCLKRPLKNSQNKGLKDKWLLNEGQKYCRMLSWSILQYF